MRVNKDNILLWLCDDEAELYIPTPLRSSCWWDLLTQLAELAQEKTGYFYDEVMHK